jgi:hypothetical protein
MGAGKIPSIVVLLLSFSILPHSAQAKYSGGSGDPNNPYQIASPADLLTLAADTNDYNKCFILTADIDLDPNLPGRTVFTTAVIAPDTNVSSPGFQGITFTGVFDGAGHKISNLTITNGTGNGNLGLFGDVSSGEVKNLDLENINITSGGGSPFASVFFGGMAGSNSGSISNCFSTGTVNAGTNSQYIGGLVGTSAGTISNCFSTASVIGTHEPHSLGGLVGRNAGGISKCSFTGTVNGGIGSKFIGGLAGGNDGGISDCFSTGDVNAGYNSYLVGGLVGDNYQGAISDCFSTGDVNSGPYSRWLGGLAGDNNGVISDCFSTGDVNSGVHSASLGGLVGGNSGNISNCFSTGDVNSSVSRSLGGLVGLHNNGSISNCYSTGVVTGAFVSIGGLVGVNNSGTISSSYFLITSGLDNGLGTPLADGQMKQQASFIGWDFVWETANGPNDIWAICEGVSSPKLAWQYIVGDSDNDKDVDFVDFALMGLKWMLADSNLYCGGADLTGDGLVDLNDLAIICDYWLEGL